MFDPAVVGTLIIGLNAERAKTQDVRPPRTAIARRRRRAGIRIALARGLRRAAALLDQPAVGEVPSAQRG